MSSQEPTPGSDAASEQLSQEELLEIATGTKRAASILLEKGRNLTEAGQRAGELASALESDLKSAPDGFFKAPLFAQVKSGLQEFNATAREQYGSITKDKLL